MRKAYLFFRPTKAEILIDNFRYNLSQIQKHIGSDKKIMAVLKADAYGHGAVPLAKIVEEENIPYIVVATLEEALELRLAHIKTPILVFGGVFHVPENYLKNELIPVLHSLDEVKEVIQFLKSNPLKNKGKFSVALMIDTGMSRLGILPTEIKKLTHILKDETQLNLEFILSHFSRSEEGIDFNQNAYQKFENITQDLKKDDIESQHYCMSNSGATLDLFLEQTDFVKPGLSLYGCYPHERQKELLDLKPVMRLKTRAIRLKIVPKGTPVGYGESFVTKRETKIATLPVGYADGYPRSLSNKAEVLVKGKRVAVIGSVCMDLITVDVTDIEDISLQDDFILLGKDQEDEITANELANLAGTISYEILTGIQKRVPRVYLDQYV